MKLKRIALFMMLLLVASIIAACGGDDDDGDDDGGSAQSALELTETFSDENVEFDYPADWVVEGGFGFYFAVSSADVLEVLSAQDSSAADLPDGAQIVLITVLDDIAEDADLEEVAASEMVGAEMGDFEEVTVGGKSGVSASFTQPASDENPLEGEGVVYALRGESGAVLILTGLAESGGFDSATAEAIAASMTAVGEEEAATEEPDDALDG